MPKVSLTIAISAGELSGEMHAAQVVKSLQKRGNIEVFGMGGSHLRAVGVDTIIDSESEAGVMGFSKVLHKLPYIMRSFRTFESQLAKRRPAALLLTDYPGFNLRLAKAAHALGIPVFYFIIPKMWIWQAGRIEQFKKFITRSFTIFPFEQKWLVDRGFSLNSFVGHPISAQLAARPFDRDAVRAALGANSASKILALLPGSRNSELAYHLPVLADTVKLLRSTHPELIAVAPVASTQTRNPLWKVAEDAGIIRSTANSLDIMRSADAGLVKSGTSNLEAAACGLPSTMIYSSSALTAVLVRAFIRKSNYSLPNIVLPGTMREIVQEELTPENLSNEVESLLSPDRAAEERRKYLAMLELLYPKDEERSDQLTPYDRVAQEILDSIASETSE